MNNTTQCRTASHTAKVKNKPSKRRRVAAAPRTMYIINPDGTVRFIR